MRYLKQINICLLFVGLASPAAWGSLFVEPSITFGTGRATYTSSNPAYLSRSLNFSGTAIGVKVGARAGSFWLGIQPVIASGKLSGSNSDGSSISGGSFSQTEVFGLVGYDFTDWLDAWVGAGVYDQRKEVYSSQESATATNNAYKVGVLAKMYKRVGLGLEYQVEQPTKFNDSQLGEIPVSGNYSKTSSSYLTFIVAFYF